MTSPFNNDDAIRLYPELHDLVALRQGGWVFRLIHNKITGGLEGISGSLSRQQYTDAIFIFDRTNVTGARVLDAEYGGGCVWFKSGADIREVVHDLLGLPEPGESGAPYLVQRSSLLWTPR